MIFIRNSVTNFAFLYVDLSILIAYLIKRHDTAPKKYFLIMNEMNYFTDKVYISVETLSRYS